MKIKFEEMSSVEIEDLVKNKGLVLVPIGACEEHGRHLPVSCDDIIAYSICLDAARELSDKIPLAVLPVVWFGYSISVIKNWKGTITINPKTLIDLLCDICKSLIDMGLVKILFVNGHGGNKGVLDITVKRIGDLYKVFPGMTNVFDLWDAEFIKNNRKSKEGGISHGCEVETSLMLHLRKELVDMSLADNSDLMKSSVESCPTDISSKRKKMLYITSWFIEDPLHGVLGDPSCASEKFGSDIHKIGVKNLIKVIEDFNELNKKIEGRKPRRKCNIF